MSKQLLFFFALSLLAIIITTQESKKADGVIDKSKATTKLVAPSMLTDKDISEIIRAVEDEIYDYGYYKKYWGFGHDTGDSKHWISEVPIYIKPSPDKDGNNWVIYRLMPYGEVYRLVSINNDGIAVLGGDPEIGFPVTQPSHLTVFDDDEEICRMKAEWKKKYFHIEDEPAISVIEKAADRQEIRVGFSYWKDKRSKNSDPKK